MQQQEEQLKSSAGERLLRRSQTFQAQCSVCEVPAAVLLLAAGEAATAEAAVATAEAAAAAAEEETAEAAAVQQLIAAGLPSILQAAGLDTADIQS